MKKLHLLLILLPFYISAQVGIGTTAPNAQLDITASNQATPSNQDGILIPRVDAFPLTNPTAAQDGMLVYRTSDKKFYYWDNTNTTWKLLGGSSVARIDDLSDGKSNDATTIFLGVNAGQTYNATGDNIVGIGNNALQSLTTGTDNIAIGSGTLKLATTAPDNIAIGTDALASNVIGLKNVAIGTKALTSNLRFYNVAIGFEALRDNTQGDENVAVGANTLAANTTGDKNVGLGISTLTSNTTGLFNLAMGSLALRNSQTGSSNVSVGGQTMFSNLTGGNNTAIGHRSLYTNTAANNNVAIGYEALFFNTAASNLATGYRASYSNSTGTRNTAYGFQALYYNTTGVDNTALGYRANFSVGQTALNNTTALGASTPAFTASNTVHIGSTGVTAIVGQVSMTQYSDKRIKDNITENVKGLDFITKLRPVTYNLNIHRQNKLMNIKDDSEVYKEKYDIEKILFTGFIAQEVEKAAKKSNYNFSGVKKPNSKNDLYKLTYSEFVVPLVKAIQEQQKMIQLLQKQVKELTKKTQKLEKK